MNKHFGFHMAQRQRSHPSLFPLRMTLFTAGLETPAQPPRLPHDVDELLALTLIEKIRRFEAAPLMVERSLSPQLFRGELSPNELMNAHA
ncbi:MAG: hypothetical protein IT313_02815 [Anaerolineales bacterium]|nr:hypothetical protein [Anaerolineales bacterium]